MFKKWNAFTIIGILLLVQSVSGAEISFKKPILSVGNLKYKAVSLTPDIYKNSKADLGDVRVLDENNSEVPYFLYSAMPTQQVNQTNLETTRINEFVKKGDTYTDFEVNTAPDTDPLASSLLLTIDATNFAKNIDLYGSYDNITWEYIGKSSIYDVKTESNKEILFDKPQKYLYYRVGILKNVENISIVGAIACYNKLVKENLPFTETMQAEYQIRSADKKDIVTIHNVKNLRLYRMTIHTSSMFERNVEVMGVTKKLFHLEFKDVLLHDTSLALDGRMTDQDNLDLVIDNQDDKPIKIDGIEIEYYTDKLVFAAESAGPYTLAYGNESLTAPQYDINQFRDYIIAEGFDLCTMGETETIQTTATAKPEAPDYGWVLNTVIIAVGVLLAILILANFKKNNNETH